MNSQGLRLQYVLNELKITPYRFSKLLGYKSPDTIYHILNEKQKVSTMMQSKIRELNLEINENWIITGEGYPFVKKLTKGGYGNEYSINGKIIYPARLSFDSIVKLARKLINELFLYMDGKSYEVKYRVSGIEGLEFLITELGFEDGERYEAKYYSLIMSPEWEIISYFDFWGIFESRIRCQNLLKTRGEMLKKERVLEKPFEFKTREFIDELTEIDFRSSGENETSEKYSILYINNPDNLVF